MTSARVGRENIDANLRKLADSAPSSPRAVFCRPSVGNGIGGAIEGGVGAGLGLDTVHLRHHLNLERATRDRGPCQESPQDDVSLRSIRADLRRLRIRRRDHRHSTGRTQQDHSSNAELVYLYLATVEEASIRGSIHR